MVALWGQTSLAQDARFQFDASQTSPSSFELRDGQVSVSNAAYGGDTLTARVDTIVSVMSFVVIPTSFAPSFASYISSNDASLVHLQSNQDHAFLVFAYSFPVPTGAGPTFLPSSPNADPLSGAVTSKYMIKALPNTSTIICKCGPCSGRKGLAVISISDN